MESDRTMPGQPAWLEDAPNEPTAFWRGYYDACRNLDRSPRMNKPQREVIHDQAAIARERLEELGVKFPDDPGRPITH